MSRPSIRVSLRRPSVHRRHDCSRATRLFIRQDASQSVCVPTASRCACAAILFVSCAKSVRIPFPTTVALLLIDEPKFTRPVSDAPPPPPPRGAAALVVVPAVFCVATTGVDGFAPTDADIRPAPICPVVRDEPDEVVTVTTSTISPALRSARRAVADTTPSKISGRSRPSPDPKQKTAIFPPPTACSPPAPGMLIRVLR